MDEHCGVKRLTAIADTAILIHLLRTGYHSVYVFKGSYNLAIYLFILGHFKRELLVLCAPPCMAKPLCHMTCVRQHTCVAQAVYGV